jgi:hypothetical protein
MLLPPQQLRTMWTCMTLTHHPIINDSITKGTTTELPQTW